MKVDRQQFMDNGYLILKNVVPPERLGELRLSVELMVDRMKARSVAQRKEGDPRGGSWYASVQPRVEMDQVLDKETANVMEFCLGETAYGVSHELLGAPETAVNSMQVSCSGLIDHGYTDWHRDASSAGQAPLGGMQSDLMENGPGYVQWNIALYDDDVFWIVPDSHKQPTDEEQRRQLLLDPMTPLKGGIPADLKAGDGIVYLNMAMHWGSFYSSRLRRTIHLGFRSFGGNIFPNSHNFHWDQGLGFTKYLSADARTHYERAVELFAKERDLIEGTFGAMLARDDEGFRARLAEVHPGHTCRMVTVVLLCRIAGKIVLLHRPDVARMSVQQRKQIVDGSPPAEFSEDMARRFTSDQAAALKQRFAELNRRLQEDADRVHQRYTEIYAKLKPDPDAPPNFESRPLRTFNHEMPKGFDVEEFVASWTK